MQTKVDNIKTKLTAIFEAVKPRVLGRTIRFTVDKLRDREVVALGVLSVQEVVDISVKRSGTGLVIIIEV